MSAWITGKREPRGPSMLTILRVYDFDARVLVDGDIYEFARELARPDRIAWAEAELSVLEKTRRGEPISDSDVAHRPFRKLAAVELGED